VDSKIYHNGALDFARFGVFMLFLCSGAVLGLQNHFRLVVPQALMNGGPHYGMVLAGDAENAYNDGQSFEFTYNTKIDTLRAVGYAEGGDLYCAAPILEPTTVVGSRIHFWATGKNCCLPRGDFWCTAEYIYGVSPEPHAPWRTAIQDLSKYAVRPYWSAREERNLAKAVHQAAALFNMAVPKYLDNIQMV